MPRPRLIAASLSVLLAAIACHLPGLGGTLPSTVPPLNVTLAVSSSLPPLILPTATVFLPTVPPLTVEMVKNGTYKTPQLGQVVTLTDGAYDRATSNEDILHVALNPVALGDLNGDGAVDAAGIMSENSGGTGFFTSLIVVLNQNGAPVQWTDRYLEDRAGINGLTIQDGRIVLDAILHGVDDPMCCPNFPVLETFRLQGRTLILTHFVSIPSGQRREILITAPGAGDSVSGSMPVAGSVTLLPFENTLAYAIFDRDENKIASGTIPVTPGAGSSGTFAASIDLSGIPLGTPVRLEISDLSAADGSLLAMDSVDVLVK
jgi:hypothetical protein